MKSDNAPWIAFWAVVGGIYAGWQVGVALAVVAALCVWPSRGNRK